MIVNLTEAASNAMSDPPTIPAPQYTLTEALSVCLAMCQRALTEVRSLARVPGPAGEAGPEGKRGEKGECGEKATVQFLNEAIAPLIARIVELETQQVPMDLAEQVKSVSRLLKDLPAITQVAPSIPKIIQPDAPPRHVSNTMITRDGELAIVYSDGTSVRLGSVTGPPGPQGSPGPAGRDGVDGAKGDEGRRGRDGVSVATTGLNLRGELVITLSDGTVHTAGCIIDGKKRA